MGKMFNQDVTLGDICTPSNARQFESMDELFDLWKDTIGSSNIPEPKTLADIVAKQYFTLFCAGCGKHKVKQAKIEGMMYDLLTKDSPTVVDKSDVSHPIYDIPYQTYRNARLPVYLKDDPYFRDYYQTSKMDFDIKNSAESLAVAKYYAEYAVESFIIWKAKMVFDFLIGQIPAKSKKPAPRAVKKVPAKSKKTYKPRNGK
jgi:hypothetical protein